MRAYWIPWIAFVVLALAAPNATSQLPTALEKAGPLGINLDEFKDWNPAWVYTDAIKAARPFTPQLTYKLLPWNTGDVLAIDAQGWPLPGPNQAAGTILFTHMNGKYPGGIYDVMYDGQGYMKVGLDAKLLESVAPGHSRYLVTPSGDGIQLKIFSSDPSDPIRNIRVIMPGFAASYTTQLFHPEFLEAIEPFGVLRMMQWQNTNFSTLEHWADRPTPDYFSQATSKGVCVEYMVALANTAHKSVWFCMPHLATDDFVRQFARYVAQNMDPDLPVYVEYSNEVWNGSFPSYWYAVSQALAAGMPGFSDFDKALKWYSQRSLEVFQIWREELEAVSGAAWQDRIVRVLAAQHANSYTSEVILDHNFAYNACDALAVAPYFGFGVGQGTPAEVAATVAKPINQLLAELDSEIEGSFAQRVADNLQVAASRGLPLIAYEGGQHLVAPGGFFADQPLTKKLIELNRDPGMYALYESMLEIWSNAGAGLMMPYSFTGSYTVFGSWGHLEYVGQPLSSAHKMRAVLDWAQSLSAQPSVSAFGTGCQGLLAGSTGTPVLGSTTFAATLSGALAQAPATLLISSEDQNFAGVPLPIDLGFLGATGCSWYIGDSFSLSTSTDATGSAAVNLALPSQPALSGTELFLQWTAFVPGFGPLGIAVSNGLAVTIG